MLYFILNWIYLPRHVWKKLQVCKFNSLTWKCRLMTNKKNTRKIKQLSKVILSWIWNYYPNNDIKIIQSFIRKELLFHLFPNLEGCIIWGLHLLYMIHEILMQYSVNCNFIEVYKMFIELIIELHFKNAWVIISKITLSIKELLCTKFILILSAFGCGYDSQRYWIK